MSEQHKLRHELTEQDNILSEVPTNQKIRDPNLVVAKPHYAQNTSTDDPMPIKMDEHPGTSARDETVAKVEEATTKVDKTPAKVDDIESTIINDETLEMSAENATTNDSHLPINDENVATLDESLQNATDDSTFVPVMTVTKQEAVLTKGDLKLQKISVTEDISDNESGGILKAINPVYSQIHSELIPGPQMIRGATEDQRIQRESEDNVPPGDKSDKDQKDKKPRTRIPRSRFKLAAEKVKKDREEAKWLKKEQVQPPEEIRRSAIPRLKTRQKSLSDKNTTKNYTISGTAQESTDNRDIPSLSDENQTTSPFNKGILKKDVSGIPVPVKTNKYFEPTSFKEINKVNTTKITSDIEADKSNLLLDNAPEDEFDKMYEDIFNTSLVEDPDIDNILDDDIEDPEKLQMSFDALINAYDENEAQPIEIKNDKSRIPLAKQKSLHNIQNNLPKQIERRFSLENEPYGNEKDKTAFNDAMDNRDTDPEDIYHSILTIVIKEAEKDKVELTNSATTKETLKNQPGELAKSQRTTSTAAVDKVEQENEKDLNVNIITEIVSSNKMYEPPVRPQNEQNQSVSKEKVIVVTPVFGNQPIRGINDPDLEKELNVTGETSQDPKLQAPNANADIIETEQILLQEEEAAALKVNKIGKPEQKEPELLAVTELISPHESELQEPKIRKDETKAYQSILIKDNQPEKENKDVIETKKIPPQEFEMVASEILETKQITEEEPKQLAAEVTKVAKETGLALPQKTKYQEPEAGDNITENDQSPQKKDDQLPSKVNEVIIKTKHTTQPGPEFQVAKENMYIIETEQIPQQVFETVASEEIKPKRITPEEPEQLAAEVTIDLKETGLPPVPKENKYVFETEITPPQTPEAVIPKVIESKGSKQLVAEVSKDLKETELPPVPKENKNVFETEITPSQTPEAIAPKMIEIKQITPDEPELLAAEVTKDLPQETKFQEPETSDNVTENNELLQKKDDQQASKVNKAIMETEHTTQQELELQVSKENKDVIETEITPPQEPETVEPKVIESKQMTQQQPELQVPKENKDVIETEITLPQELETVAPKVIESKQITQQEPELQVPKENKDVIETEITLPQGLGTVAPKVIESKQITQQEPELQVPKENKDVIETENTLPQEFETVAPKVIESKESEQLAAEVTIDLKETGLPLVPKENKYVFETEITLPRGLETVAPKVIESKQITQQEPELQVPKENKDVIETENTLPQEFETVAPKVIESKESEQLAAEVTIDLKGTGLPLVPKENKYVFETEITPPYTPEAVAPKVIESKGSEQLVAEVSKDLKETGLPPVPKENKDVFETEIIPSQTPEAVAPKIIESKQITSDEPELLAAEVTKDLPQETKFQEPETSGNVTENDKLLQKKDDQLASQVNKAIMQTEHTTQRELELQVPKENKDVIETEITLPQGLETVATKVIESKQITQQEPELQVPKENTDVIETEITLPQELQTVAPKVTESKESEQLAAEVTKDLKETGLPPVPKENKDVFETEITPSQTPEAVAPEIIENKQITPDEPELLAAEVTEDLPQETKFQEREASDDVTENDQVLQKKDDQLASKVNKAIMETKYTAQQEPELQVPKENKDAIETEITPPQEPETVAPKVIESKKITQQEPELQVPKENKDVIETEITPPQELETVAPKVIESKETEQLAAEVAEDVEEIRLAFTQEIKFQEPEASDDVIKNEQSSQQLASTVNETITETKHITQQGPELQGSKENKDVMETEITPPQRLEAVTLKIIESKQITPGEPNQLAADITENKQTSHTMLAPKLRDDIPVIKQTISIIPPQKLSIIPQKSELLPPKAIEDVNKSHHDNDPPLKVRDDLEETEQTRDLVAPNIRDSLTVTEQIQQYHDLPAVLKVNENTNLNEHTLCQDNSDLIKTKETLLQGQRPQEPKTEICEENYTHPPSKEVDDQNNTNSVEINETEQDDKFQQNNSPTSIPDSSRMVQNILLRITSRTDIEHDNHKNISYLDKGLSNKELSDIQAKSIKEYQISIIGENIRYNKQIEAPAGNPVKEETYTVDKIDNKIISIPLNHEKSNNHEPEETIKILSVKSRIALFSQDKNVDHERKVKDEILKPITFLKHNAKDHEDQIQRNKYTQLKIVKDPHESIDKETIEKLQDFSIPAFKNKNINHEIQKHESEPYIQEVHHDSIPAPTSRELTVSENTCNKVLEKEINDKTTANEENLNDGIPVDEITVLKGKVSRIIGRLTSHDENTEIPNKEILEEELPIKKSVSARVALFERQGSKEPTAKTVKPNYKLERGGVLDQKPKIVDHVLKTQPDGETIANKQNSTFKINLNKVEESESDINNDQIFEENIGNKEIKTDDKIFKNKDITIQNIIGEQTDYIIKPAHSNTTTIPKETRFITTENNQNQSSERNADIPNTRNEVPNVVYRESRLRTRTRDVTKRRSRSTAEIDLGDAIRGKVQDMIFRINSMDNLDETKDKKEIIRVTERPTRMKEKPRSRSVSEKIALFEKKTVPTKMADPMTVEAMVYTEPMAPINIAQKTVSKQIETKNPTVEKYAQRIADLKNSKITYGSMKNMMYIRLNDDYDMPVLAVGTAILDPQLIKHVIGAAIDLGYRGIDTAYIYGNEQAVGEAIREKIADGTVIREDLFITNKLWSTNHRQDLVEKACRASLAAMGLDYFNLYLVHNPMSFKEGGDPIPKIAKVLQYSDFDYMDAWYGMEGLVNKGLVRSIGVSNFNAAQITRVYEKARIKPVINQVECHPYLTQQRLDQVCLDRGIKLSCFGVLGSKGTPAELRGSQTPVIEDPMVVVMAAGMGITPAQLLVRYQIQSGHGVVAKSSSAAHLWDNLRALTFNIDPIAMDALSALNRNKRTYTFAGMGDTHRNYPFKDLF